MCDVEAGHGNRQQAYGSEYGETSAHIVGDDEALVSFRISRGTGGTFLGIGYGHDDFASHVLAALVFALLFQQAESQSRFGGRAALGNIDDTEFLVGQVSAHFGQIVFADVVSGKQDDRVLLIVQQPLEAVAQGFDDGACAKVASADAGYYDHFAVLAEHLCRGVQFTDEIGSNGRRQVQPS